LEELQKRMKLLSVLLWQWCSGVRCQRNKYILMYVGNRSLFSINGT